MISLAIDISQSLVPSVVSVWCIPPRALSEAPVLVGEQLITQATLPAEQLPLDFDFVVGYYSNSIDFADEWASYLIVTTNISAAYNWTTGPWWTSPYSPGPGPSPQPDNGNPQFGSGETALTWTLILLGIGYALFGVSARVNSLKIQARSRLQWMRSKVPDLQGSHNVTPQGGGAQLVAKTERWNAILEQIVKLITALGSLFVACFFEYACWGELSSAHCAYSLRFSSAAL